MEKDWIEMEDAKRLNKFSIDETTTISQGFSSVVGTSKQKFH